ncbi:biotin/lipoyl-containing protein [Candidatus Chlorohelix sp.]|uniref:biotin/lipoyl-containing protein n=1 Tax=Candidatus Chlorohelix sp. TaxID=3139201 RepID=UPI003052E069
MTEVKAPISGTVWQIPAVIGQAVEEEEDLIILESMKMEIPVSAPLSGTVREIRVEAGNFVNQGDILIVLE